MKDSVALKLTGNMKFNASVNGHEIVIDASSEAGGQNSGPRPKSLMMVALAGCTGMDVASLLRKMRVEFEDFRVEVDGMITEDHPRHYEHMHIRYILKGKDIQPDKVQNAINLSQEKYCGVSYNYRQSMKITHELIIE